MQPTMQPIAQSLAGQGRYGDSMLVHMNPQEVAGLQALAMRQGGSLTVNPETGLPEAFSLKSILPMVAGAALTPVMGPAGAALAVGGLGTLMTGNLQQGLMMGLGAMGGANMAGSFANLAAPAVSAASAAPSAAIAAPAAIGGAAGAPGVLASAAPATTLAGATQFAPAASVGGIGFNAPAFAPTTTVGSSLLPTAASEGVKAAVTPSLQVSAPFATTEPISNIIPTSTPSSLARPPVSGISKLFQPDERTTYENIGAGMKKAFSSGENLMGFLGDNKMNLAMSAAPLLISPEQEEVQRQRAMIRPYTYEVDNLSGAPIDPYGVEAERLRGRFVAGTPYYAAQGGLMSLAEGGSTSTATTTTAAPATTETATQPTQYLTPAQENVFRNIFAAQQMADMPTAMSGQGLADMARFMSLAPSVSRPPLTYTPSPVLDTSEKRFTPASTVNTVIEKKEEVKPERSRSFRPFGVFRRIGIGGGGGDSSKSVSNKFSYDPTTGTYKQLAEGGSVSNDFNAGGIASLRENDFILPADVISHMGNGSSDAGMEIAITQFKARPIKGKGDGMSDSIPTSIEGKQKALVAHEEALIPREMVAFLGGGSVQKGAEKLEKFMDRVRKARTGKKKQAPEIDVSRYMPA